MEDVTAILEQWPYDPQQTVRIIIAADGRSVMQVRLPLGIEQYEMEGRPDGLRPHGASSVLEHVQERLKNHIVSHGTDAGFRVTTMEAGELQAEGVLYYYRYLLLFQLQHLDTVVRDTEHNLQLCDLLENYCENADARNGVLQFRPYIMRMNAAARVLAISRGEMEGDFRQVADEVVAHIEALEEIDTPAFQFERIRSVNYLKALVRKLETGRDDGEESVSRESEGSSLAEKLQEAVAAEDYEEAARLRDLLRRQDSL